jgi:co-chaperonin GroES (HSP10)|tara:strand:+ start:444 stop:701 length:258 start_codon:yes stop_codon:yes gene_type:complete
MKAVNHYVVVEKIKETEKKVGGLILTEDINQDVRYSKGKVISAGSIADFVSEGNIVWYDKHAGHGIEYNDKFYFVIKASDIVLVD